jgi:hypothetical protein
MFCHSTYIIPLAHCCSVLPFVTDRTNEAPLNIVKQNVIIPSLATVSTLNQFIDPISAVEGHGGGRKPVQDSGVGGSEGGSWSHYVAYVLVFLGSIIICQLYLFILVPLT